MKNSIKGLLLSGLVVPGLGQFMLKRKQRGMVLMLATLVVIVLFVAEATRQAMHLLEQALASGSLVTMDDVVAVATAGSSAAGSPVIAVSSVLLLVLWFFAMADAYVIGRRMDKTPFSEDRSSSLSA